MQVNKASFRDPSGQVFVGDKTIFRSVMPVYADEWTFLTSCGLLPKAQILGLVSFETVPHAHWPACIPCHAVQVLRSPKVPFVSYPYEWCFSQLKAAALLTLDLHLLALEHGCILKDASAYNIQFNGGKPVFIDLLSFERWQIGQPWQAYGQFCRHFLAPLALMSYKDVRLGQILRQWVDGVPLDLASALLPFRSRLSLGLQLHLHMHARMQKKHGAQGASAQKARLMKMSLQKMLDVGQSLKDTVLGLRLPTQDTEWGDYYNDTNYTPKARQAKEDLVAKMAATCSGDVAIDLGGNAGDFTRLVSGYFKLVLACDNDHTAVERHWHSQPCDNVFPMVLDLANPSPAIGWACQERESIMERCKADFVMALALCHHLRFTCGIPFPQLALFFRRLVRDGGFALLEFVPKEDSQVQRMLTRRDDVFGDYTEESFCRTFQNEGFILQQRYSIVESKRSLFLFQKVV